MGKLETVTDLILGGSKITSDSDCSHEIKRRLLLGRKVMTNLDSILKSRVVTLPTKVHLVKAMVFPVVMYGCESWTLKKAECQRIDAFELWCWRRQLRVPWTARRSNQSILKEISPGCSLERLMLKLKLHNFGHLMQRTDSSEKTLCWERLKAGGEGNDRRWDGWMASPTQWMCLGKFRDLVMDREAWHAGLQRVRHDWVTELNLDEKVCLDFSITFYVLFGQHSLFLTQGHKFILLQMCQDLKQTNPPEREKFYIFWTLI